MGITDKLKDLTKKAQDTAAEHKDQIHDTVEKAAALADERTGGRYSEKIAKAGAKADSYLDTLPTPTPTPTPAPGQADDAAAAESARAPRSAGE